MKLATNHKLITIVIFATSLLSFNVYADTICGAKYITDQSLKWTGECVNGQANGVGLMSFVYIDKDGKRYSQETFGRFINGNWSGLHLYATNTDTQKYKFVKYYNNSIENIIGPIVVTGSDNMHLPLYQHTWSDVNAKPDANNNQPEISYKKALNDIKAYIAQRNEPSIDFEVFKAYLEGKISPTDVNDSPVLGVTLSLGDASSGEAKPKKKSKKK